MRNKIIMLSIPCLGLLFSSCSLAQTKHEQAKKNFEEIKLEAQQTGKLIFVDLYFEGCVPCKKMEQEVFPDAVLDNVLKKSFITYKADVFKALDAKKLSRKYGVSGFPSFIILDSKGKTLRTESGFLDRDQLVTLLNDAIDLYHKGYFLAYDTNLDKPYPTFYSNLYMERGQRLATEEMIAFVERQQDPYEEMCFVLGAFGLSKKYNEWMYQHRDALQKRYGKTNLRNPMAAIAQSKSKRFGEQHQLDSMVVLLEEIKPLFAERLWSIYLPKWIDAFYKEDQNVVNYQQLLERFRDRGQLEDAHNQDLQAQ